MQARLLIACLLLAVGAAVAPASALARTYIEVTVPPPPPPPAVAPPARDGYVWSPPYWRWQGNRHVWTEGRWIRARAGYRWVPEQWVDRGKVYRLIPGHWEREDAPPATNSRG